MHSLLLQCHWLTWDLKLCNFPEDVFFTFWMKIVVTWKNFLQCEVFPVYERYAYYPGYERTIQMGSEALPKQGK